MLSIFLSFSLSRSLYLSLALSSLHLNKPSKSFYELHSTFMSICSIINVFISRSMQTKAEPYFQQSLVIVATIKIAALCHPHFFLLPLSPRFSLFGFSLFVFLSSIFSLRFLSFPHAFFLFYVIIPLTRTYNHIYLMCNLIANWCDWTGCFSYRDLTTNSTITRPTPPCIHKCRPFFCLLSLQSNQRIRSEFYSRGTTKKKRQSSTNEYPLALFPPQINQTNRYIFISMFDDFINKYALLYYVVD